MDVKTAYNKWAEQYDTNQNKTRDLEGVALRTVLGGLPFDNCLEIGCGTGKNTVWLANRVGHITAVDFSAEMLAKAKKKITMPTAQFIQADITHPWAFGTGQYNLVTFSLVLEHISDLGSIFSEASRALVPGGFVYIGELHPFKQYSGTKARFETEDGLQIVDCFTHHVSDFILAGKQNGLVPVDINEHFDDGDRGGIPRILTMVLRKAA